MRRSLLAAVWCALSPPLAWAEDAAPVLHVEVVADGTPSVNQRTLALQLAAIREAALADALPKLRLVAIDHLLHDDPATRDSQLFDDWVMHTDYVSNEQVVTDTRKGVSSFMLVVGADVDAARMRADIERVRADRARLGRLKVMVCVAGTVASEKGTPVAVGSARTTMEAMLRRDGWQVVPAQPLASTRPEDIAATLALQPADFIVYGTEAFAPAPPGDAGVAPPQRHRQRDVPTSWVAVSYDLSIIDAATWSSLATAADRRVEELPYASGRFAGPFDYSGDDYGALVARRAAAPLRDAALAAAEHRRVAELTLTVENLRPADADAFVNWVKSKPQLKSISRRDQLFIVTPTGTLLELATALDGQRFKGKAISVSKVTATTIAAHLAK